MRISTIVVKTSIAMIFATSTAFARVPKTEGTKLIISVKSTENQKEDCEVVRSSLFTLIKNQLRFVPRVSGPAAFLLEVRCTAGNLAGRFFMTNGKDSAVNIAAHDLALSDQKTMKSPTTVAELWAKIQDKLPWSGEILTLSNAEPPADRPRIDGNVELHAKGIVSMGLNSNNLLGACIPLEIGTITALPDGNGVTFKNEYPGLLREVDSFQSRLEIYTLNERIELQKIYVVRPGDPAKQPKGMGAAVKYCQSKPNAAAPTKVADLMSEVFGKDFVEVNNIKQRYGAAFTAIRGTNGATANTLAAAYIHNRLLFGGNFMIDAFALRSIYSKPWNFATLTELNPPEVTAAEVFVTTSARVGRFSGFIGLGLTIDKTNLPYNQVSTDGSGASYPNQRAAFVRGGGIIGTNTDLSSRFEYALRIPVSQRNGSVYIDIHNMLSYRLSATWTTGADLMIINTSAKEPGAPSATVSSLGAFLGVEVGK